MLRIDTSSQVGMPVEIRKSNQKTLWEGRKVKRLSQSEKEIQHCLFAVKNLQGGFLTRDQRACLQERGLIEKELQSLENTLEKSRFRLRGGMPAGHVELNVDFVSQRLEEAKEAVRPAFNQNVVVVLGNTGSGKSTFVNHMYGRRMGLRPGSADQIDVITADGGQPPVTTIGHGGPSLTQFPVIPLEDGAEGLVFADCPGFFDNRGPNFDIPNCYAINEMIKSSTSIQAVIVVVPYGTFDAERGRGFKGTEDILQKIFGDDLDRYREKLFFLVTKCTSRDTQEGEDIDLDSMREVVRGVQATEDDPPQAIELPEEAKSSIQKMDRRFFLYDPLGEIDGGVTRAQLLEWIRACEGIDKTAFQAFLSGDSRERLVEYFNSNKEKLIKSFEERNFPAMATTLDLTRKCELIPRQFAGNYFVDQVREVQRRLDALAHAQPELRAKVVILEGDRSQISLHDSDDRQLHAFTAEVDEEIEQAVETYLSQTQTFRDIESFKRALEEKELLLDSDMPQEGVMLVDSTRADEILEQKKQTIIAAIKRERDTARTQAESDQLEREERKEERLREEERQAQRDKYAHDLAVENVKADKEIKVKELENKKARIDGDYKVKQEQAKGEHEIAKAQETTRQEQLKVEAAEATARGNAQVSQINQDGAEAVAKVNQQGAVLQAMVNKYGDAQIKGIEKRGEVVGKVMDKLGNVNDADLTKVQGLLQAVTSAIGTMQETDRVLGAPQRKAIEGRK